MDADRLKARWRKRRIIYNNDGDDVIEARSGVEHEYDVSEALTVRATGDLVQDFLDARSTPLIGTQVDSNWFSPCMAGLTFSHHTKLGGFYDLFAPYEVGRILRQGDPAGIGGKVRSRHLANTA